MANAASRTLPTLALRVFFILSWPHLDEVNKWHRTRLRPALLEPLAYPILVISTNKLTAALRVQNVKIGSAESTATLVLAKWLFCKHATLL